MSTRLRSTQKPPLAKSPIRARPRRILSQSNSMQTPPGSLTKSVRPNRAVDQDELEIRPEYLTISCELRALAKRVRDELGEDERVGLTNAVGFCGSAARAPNTSPLFERGRFYEEYSARRNERLKRKKGQKGEESAKLCYKLGVTVDSAKRGTSKKLGNLRKSISAVERTSETPRYMLRSMSKDNNKKPPLPLYAEKSVTRRLKKPLY